MADFWKDFYKATVAAAKEIQKGVSAVGTAVSQSPTAQQAIASSVASTQDANQASATAAAQAQAAAEQKKLIETTKTNAINASNDAMIKQASAAAKGFSSNILTGAQGVDKSKEKTSALVLGGSDASGSPNLGGMMPQQMQGRVKKFLGR
jgi:hypothetical protein